MKARLQCSIARTKLLTNNRIWETAWMKLLTNNRIRENRLSGVRWKSHAPFWGGESSREPTYSNYWV